MAARTAEPARNVPQFPDGDPEREHDRAGANTHHAGDDQGVAGTEFLDRNSEADRQQARQNKADPDDQHNKHHRTNPRSRALNARKPPNATIPSYCAASPTAIEHGFRKTQNVARVKVCGVDGSLHSGLVQRGGRNLPPTFTALLLHCISELGHNSQLLGNGTALYGYRGMRLKSAVAGP